MSSLLIVSDLPEPVTGVAFETAAAMRPSPRHSVFPPETVRCAKTSPAVCRPLTSRPFRPVPKLSSVPGHSLTDAQRPGPQTPFPSTTALVPEGQGTLAEVSDLCPPSGQPARPSGLPFRPNSKCGKAFSST